MLDKVHLVPNGPTVYDVITREEHIKCQPCYYGSDKDFVSIGKKRYHPDQLLTVEVDNFLWSVCAYMHVCVQCVCSVCTKCTS